MFKKKFKKSTIITIALALTATSLSTQALAWGGSKDKAKSNYKISNKSIKVIESDMEKQILEAATTIKAQLELLNDTKVSIQDDYSTGISAKYKVPSNQNLQEISHKDVKLIVKEGRSNNNPSKKYDMIHKGEVVGDISKENMRNFYKTPVQSGKNIEIDKHLTTNNTIANTTGLKQIDLDKNINKNKNSKQNKVKNNKVGLERLIKINGTYTTSQIIMGLANGAGYKFELIGEDKEYSITIGNKDISYTGTIKDALINVGNQIADKGVINVDMKNKTITMEYK